MPTYAYACTACEHRFEIVQSFQDDSLTDCPECEGRLRKLFNAVGVVFKGSGFYRNDSRNDSRGKTRGGTTSGSDRDSGRGSGKDSRKDSASASPSSAPSVDSSSSSSESSSSKTPDSSPAGGKTKTPSRSVPTSASRSEGSAA